MAPRLALPGALAGTVLGVLIADAGWLPLALLGGGVAVIGAGAFGLMRMTATSVACAALALGLVIGAWRGTTLPLPWGPDSVSALIGRGEIRLVGIVVDDPRPRGRSQQVVLEQLRGGVLAGAVHS